MVKHVALMSVAVLLLIGCMFYPFFPGQCDALATTLSAMSQVFAVVGLALVPFGSIWLAYELRTCAASAGSPPAPDRGYWFALAAIGLSSIVVVAVSLAAFATNVGLSVALGVIILWTWCAWRLTAKLKTIRSTDVRTFNAAPLYLIVLPLVAAVCKFTLLAHAAEFSRNRAIDNSARLISDIERYRDVHGHYPRALNSLNEDYQPGVIGVNRYQYEPSGDGYNLYFEHFALALDAKEIVMFNRRDEQEFTSHNADLLEYTGTDLKLRRGYISVHDASRRNWRYFLFD
jgi:hypothetical protein